jgi:hypothetical protein
MVAEARPALPSYLLLSPVKPLNALKSLNLPVTSAVRTLHALLRPGLPATPELGSTCTP